MEDIFKKDLSGELVSPDEPGYDKLINAIWDTMKLAAELGTVALLSNIFREMITLIGTPFMARKFGPLAPVASAGATAMDVCLPVILKYTGNSMLPAAVISGIVSDFSVPLLVTLFC